MWTQAAWSKDFSGDFRGGERRLAAADRAARIGSEGPRKTGGEGPESAFEAPCRSGCRTDWFVKSRCPCARRRIDGNGKSGGVDSTVGGGSPRDRAGRRRVERPQQHLGARSARRDDDCLLLLPAVSAPKARTAEAGELSQKS